MPTLWNVGASPVVLNWLEPAIMPGEPHEFTDEQVAAGIAGEFSDKDPRAGLGAERAFKQRRDAASNDTPADAKTSE